MWRELDAAGQQVGLLAHVGDRVLGELGQRLVDPLALLLQLAFQLGAAEDPAAQHLLVADQHRAAVDPQPVAVFEQLEEAGAGGVDEADPLPRQHQRAGVGVLAVGGGRGVEDRGDAGFDQLLGGDAVDVDVVDDGDVAGPQALDQVLGPLAQPGRAFDRRFRAHTVATPEQSRKATATGGGHATQIRRQGWAPQEQGVCYQRLACEPKCRRSLSGQRPQQLAGVAGGGLVGALAAEHAADLLDHALAVEALDGGQRARPRRLASRAGSGRRRARRPGAGG